jgi:hypothetical protein
MGLPEYRKKNRKTVNRDNKKGVAQALPLAVGDFG